MLCYYTVARNYLGISYSPFFSSPNQNVVHLTTYFSTLIRDLMFFLFLETCVGNEHIRSLYRFQHALSFLIPLTEAFTLMHIFKTGIRLSHVAVEICSNY